MALPCVQAVEGREALHQPEGPVLDVQGQAPGWDQAAEQAAGG
jgi:hypothetical protein